MYILRKLKYSFWCGCNINGASLVAQLVKNSPANAGNVRHGFAPWVRKIPQRRKWQPAPVFLSGKFYGQVSLAGYSPWGCKEWDTKENTHTHTPHHTTPHHTTHTHTHTHPHTQSNLNGVMLPSSGEVMTHLEIKCRMLLRLLFVQHVLFTNTFIGKIVLLLDTIILLYLENVLICQITTK